MLLSITNDFLEQNKIISMHHRHSILVAIGDLKQASCQMRSESLLEVGGNNFGSSFSHFFE
jgi:hypothetical protein